MDATYSTRELVDLVATKPLEFTPGTRFKYSNAGYYVLGYLIEQMSGQSYADYLRTHIFEPLGMTDSGYDSVLDLIERHAIGYGKDGSRLQYAMHVDWSLASAAGALYSTVDDLLRWDRGLASDALLPESMRMHLQTPTPERYSAGWFVDRDKGRLRMYHEGSNPGYAGFIYRYPDDGLFVVVLSNLETAPVRPIADALATLASGS
jgi:CubicO group peptidase (beta-lactamase class C family)